MGHVAGARTERSDILLEKPWSFYCKITDIINEYDC